ncbi:phage baseplate assembly protein [Fusobacterium polymorphum]|uniref:phage baseplate assembly protein n=2 Tax=Fusobacteriaceae TaxID=203492 RepID=UPI00300BCFAB
MMENIRIILVKIQKIRKGRFVDAEPLFSPNGVTLPVLRNVPVALFGDSKDHIDWNIKEGDIMPYFILTFDISSYISQGSHDVMDSNRRNNLNNGFILPFTIPNATENLEFPSDIRIIGDRLEEGNIDLTGDSSQKGNVEITGNTTQNGNTTQTGNISSTGTVSATEDVKAGDKSLKNHKHSGVTKGNDTSGGVV